jgi:hypothetical protein
MSVTSPEVGRPSASTNAVVRSLCAVNATASATCSAPRRMPGGKPVTAVPGLTPRSSASTEAPVFVTVWPASTEYLAAVPRSTLASAALAGEDAAATKPAASSPTVATA